MLELKYKKFNDIRNRVSNIIKENSISELDGDRDIAQSLDEKIQVFLDLAVTYDELKNSIARFRKKKVFIDKIQLNEDDELLFECSWTETSKYDWEDITEDFNEMFVPPTKKNIEVINKWIDEWISRN